MCRGNIIGNIGAVQDIIDAGCPWCLGRLLGTQSQSSFSKNKYGTRTSFASIPQTVIIWARLQLAQGRCACSQNSMIAITTSNSISGRRGACKLGPFGRSNGILSSLSWCASYSSSPFLLKTHSLLTGRFLLPERIKHSEIFADAGAGERIWPC